MFYSELLNGSTVSSGYVQVLSIPRLSPQASVCLCLASHPGHSPLKRTVSDFLYLPWLRFGSSTRSPRKFPWTDLVSHSQAWYCSWQYHARYWLGWWICSTLSANVQALNFLLEMGHVGYWQHFQNLGLRGCFRSHWGGCWALFNVST